MEVPPNHAAKKNTSKTTPPAINIGAGTGSFGNGGILLFGGALVTATIASALAFKRRRQRRSPSDAGKTSRSPSPVTQTVGAQNPPEFKSNKPVQDSNPEEKQTYEEEMDSGDVNEKILSCVVGEDEENYVDSGFQDKEVDNENNEQSLDKSLVWIEAVTMIKDDASEEESRHVDEDQEQFLEKKGVDETILKNSNGDLIEGNRIENEVTRACVDFENRKDVSEMAYHEALGAEEMHVNEDQQRFSGGSAVSSIMNLNESLIVTVSEESSSMPSIIKEEKGQEQDSEDVQEIEEAKTDDQKLEMEENREETEQKVEEEVSRDVQSIEEAKVDDQKVEREENHKETAQKVEEEVSTDVQETEEAKVDNQKVEREENCEETEQKVEKHVSKNVQSIEEAKVDDQKLEREENRKETAQKVEEVVSTYVQVTEEAKVDDQKVEREENHEETANKVKEQVTTDVQAIEEAKVDEQKREENHEEMAQKVDEEEVCADVQETEEPKVDEQKVKRGENDKERIKEDETTKDNMKDVIWPDETKIGNLKIDEKIDKNKRILSKEQNGIIKNKGSKHQWNLKLWSWSVLASIWCLWHWYADLPFPGLSLITSFFFILILLRHQIHTIKHE